MSKNSKDLRRKPLDSLVEYIRHSDFKQRKVLAAKCGTNIANLRQIAYGYGACSIGLAKKIVKGCQDPEINLDVKLGDLIPELEGLSDGK